MRTSSLSLALSWHKAGARLKLAVPRDPPSRALAEIWQQLSSPELGSPYLGELPEREGRKRESLPPPL